MLRESARRTTAGLCVLAALIFLAGGTGEAATRTVTGGADDGGVGTLRYVVANAVDGDAIVFHSSVPTVSLTDELFVDKPLTITGPVTIRQTTPGKRVLYVTGSCTLKKLTITGGSLPGGGYGAGMYCCADVTMIRCLVKNNTGGGGIHNTRNLVLQDCTISGNTGEGGLASGGIHNSGSVDNASLTMTDCVVENNTCSGYTWGRRTAGGIFNDYKSTLTMVRTKIRNNGSSGKSDYSGGGLFLEMDSTTRLTDHCVVSANTPDNINRYYYDVTYSADDTCTVGDAPNRSATAFAGYSGETEPEPRSIEGDEDVAAVKTALENPQSGLYAVIERALAADLGKTVPEKSTSLAPLAGMTASLYYANTFENVALASTDLSVEYTASWPGNVRYYSLFARADETGYEIPGRGVQFELHAGQTLPDGVTPPDFYVPGEGLMTWRNVVTDGGSYDLNPTAGVVTFRVCSVRAAEVAGDKGGGGGCDIAAGAGFAPLALLLIAPLCAFVWSKGSVRK